MSGKNLMHLSVHVKIAFIVHGIPCSLDKGETGFIDSLDILT